MVNVEEALLHNRIDWVHHGFQVNRYIVGQSDLEIGNGLPDVAGRHKVSGNEKRIGTIRTVGVSCTRHPIVLPARGSILPGRVGESIFCRCLRASDNFISTRDGRRRDGRNQGAEERQENSVRHQFNNCQVPRSDSQDCALDSAGKLPIETGR